MAAETETCYRHTDVETLVHCTRCSRPICPDCMTPAPVGHHCPECVAEGARDLKRRRMTLPRPKGVSQAIVAVNIVVFVLQMILGGATRLDVLVRMGAMVPALVADGEYWRLLASTFLHIGVLHIALNMIGVYLFGSMIEAVLGSGRMLAVYLVTGFVASCVSYSFGSPARIAAGASGAVFGLLGVWLTYNWRRRSLSVAQANVRGALLLIGVNVVLAFTLPGIDNLTHLGGLGAGVVAGLIADAPGRGTARLALVVAGLVGMVVAGAALVAWRTAGLAS